MRDSGFNRYPQVKSSDPVEGCIEFALSNRSTTFAELEGVLGSVYGMPKKRDDGFVTDIFVDDWSNVIVWTASTPERGRVLSSVIRDERVEMKQTVPFLYIMDGMVLTTPLAKRVPKSGYKSIRWLPVVIIGKEHV